MQARHGQHGFTILEGIVAMTLAVSLFVAVANVLVSMSKVYSSTYLSDMGEAEAEVFRTEFDYALKNCQEFKIYSSADVFSAAGQPANSGNLLMCTMGLGPTKYLFFWFQPDQSGSGQGKLCYGEVDTAGQPSLPAVYATFHDSQYSPYTAVVNTDLFSMASDPTTGQPSGLVRFSYSITYERERVSYIGISYALSMR
ncbi:MAG: hypothetical protein WB586_08260 [Chthoniobacterales bacterium]